MTPLTEAWGLEPGLPCGSQESTRRQAAPRSSCCLSRLPGEGGCGGMGQVTPSGEQLPTVSRKSTEDPPRLPSHLPDLSSSREILCLETALGFHHQHQFFPLEPRRAKQGPLARPAFRLARREGTKLGPLPLPTRTHRRSRGPGTLRRPSPSVCPCHHACAHMCNACSAHSHTHKVVRASLGAK